MCVFLESTWCPSSRMRSSQKLAHLYKSRATKYLSAQMVIVHGNFHKSEEKDRQICRVRIREMEKGRMKKEKQNKSKPFEILSFVWHKQKPF